MSNPRCLTHALAAAMVLCASAARAQDQVVTGCASDAELRAKLTTMQAGSGGTLTFACGTATIVVAGALPVITKPTVIDGDGAITLSGGNSDRILLVASGATLELEDLVLTNGSSNGDGGAIANEGSLTIRDCTVRNSSSALSGGAIVTYGPLVIEDSELHGNFAKNGGAVYARFAGAPVEIRRSILHHNETPLDEKTNDQGGAVFLWDGATLLIEDSRLHDNRAALGGALFNAFANSSITVIGTRIDHNYARSTGGGIFSFGGPLTLLEVDVDSNSTAGSAGGVHYSAGGSLTISDSTIRANQGGDGTGGLTVGSSTGVQVTNVTITGNSGESVAGVLSASSVVSMTNVTIAGNDSTSTGGILNVASAGQGTTLRNVLLSDNTGGNCEHVGDGSIVSADGNLSSDFSCSTWLTGLHDGNGPSADAKLGPLGDHGGATPTLVPQPGSPALDGGISGGAPPEDQRGIVRPQGAAVDVGAVEVVPCNGSTLCGDANGNGSLSASDALRALQSAVGSADCGLWLCDFNGDDAITAGDALAILRASVGQPSSPSCPAAWDCLAD